MRCLIVDDSERFVRSARRLLEREGATVVATVATGADALAAAAATPVDVSLVDVQLGGESGVGVADALARRGLGGTILLISTLAADDVADLLAGSAAVGFVAKSDLSVAAIQRASR
ncbi:response regulator [Asanoa iriomotensis]|uniref:Response regulator n=1 Tax=Asanoa iriomotensis TaxID=234613 RepID=A0ABQ4BZL7_9ACTN|nr:response regulator [Asanoa iriomotensis]GIF55978.1 response regulator [Asanoa iriomotensis]